MFYISVYSIFMMVLHRFLMSSALFQVPKKHVPTTAQTMEFVTLDDASVEKDIQIMIVAQKQIILSLTSGWMLKYPLNADLMFTIIRPRQENKKSFKFQSKTDLLKYVIGLIIKMMKIFFMISLFSILLILSKEVILTSRNLTKLAVWS